MTATADGRTSRHSDGPEPFEQQLPYDLDAERGVLCGMFDDPRGIDAAAGLLTEEDFHRPAHQVTFAAIVALHAAGEPASPVTVAQWLAASGQAAALGDQARMYLFELWQLRFTWFHVASCAATVRDRAVRRRTILAGTRICQLARTQPDLDELAAGVRVEADAAVTLAGQASPRATRLVTAEEFMSSERAIPDPVIPGVVNRMDRVVVVGGSGSGKTTLALQVAAAAAVGVHPFARDRYDPVRVLVIDLEMPAYLLEHAITRVFRAARGYGDPFDGGRLQIVHRPRGIDLGQRGQAHLLAGMIRKADPDLVIAGPVYKMHADAGERGEHTVVMDFWDDMRDRHDCALWLETHPAKGRFGKTVWEPSGSGRWRDWPEIGFAMVPVSGKDRVMEVRPFRGMRDRDRAWPEQFTGTIGAGWPWQATYPPGTLPEEP